jgi:hypothetical protein
MSADETDDAEKQARIDVNMALASWFLRDVIADPSILDEIPDGATLFLLPEGDAAFVAASRTAARNAEGAGRTAHLRRVPGLRTTGVGRPHRAGESPSHGSAGDGMRHVRSPRRHVLRRHVLARRSGRTFRMGRLIGTAGRGNLLTGDGQ